MIVFFLETSIDVSGSLHRGQSTHSLMNLSVFSCSAGVSCQPVIVPVLSLLSNVEMVPSSTAQYLVRYCGGRLSDFPTSDTFTSTVFFPLPRPSCLPSIAGILYRYAGSSPPPMLRSDMVL
jgi:hypothetical protein